MCLPSEIYATPFFTAMPNPALTVSVDLEPDPYVEAEFEKASAETGPKTTTPTKAAQKFMFRGTVAESMEKAGIQFWPRNVKPRCTTTMQACTRRTANPVLPVFETYNGGGMRLKRPTGAERKTDSDKRGRTLMRLRTWAAPRTPSPGGRGRQRAVSPLGIARSQHPSNVRAGSVHTLAHAQGPSSPQGPLPHSRGWIRLLPEPGSAQEGVRLVGRSPARSASRSQSRRLASRSPIRSARGKRVHVVPRQGRQGICLRSRSRDCSPLRPRRSVLTGSNADDIGELIRW